MDLTYHKMVNTSDNSKKENQMDKENTTNTVIIYKTQEVQDSPNLVNKQHH